jgi:hypothetical protein
MNAAIFAAPIPAVYLSPQAISPISASNIPVALNLTQRVDLADPAATTSAKLKQDHRGHHLLNHRQDAGATKRTGTSASATSSSPVVVLDGKVDVYV